jgi:hypothetical protein
MLRLGKSTNVPHYEDRLELTVKILTKRVFFKSPKGIDTIIALALPRKRGSINRYIIFSNPLNDSREEVN